MSNGQFKKALLQVLASIPEGKVMFYGQIADLIGTEARAVGQMLTGLTHEEAKSYPWYRVVAKDGYISSTKLGERGELQKQLLEKEGYEVNSHYKVNMDKHLWLFAGIERLENKVEQYEDFCEGLKRYAD